MNPNFNNDVLLQMFTAPNNRATTAQELALAQVARRKYFIGSIDKDGNFSIASRPVEQLSADAACAERNRLAASNPGKVYFVALFHSAAKAGGVTVY